MSTISIKVNGLDKLVKGLATASKETKRALSKAVIRSTLIIQRAAKELVPVDTGRLQKSILINTRPLEGIISARAKYAGYVEFGTKKMRAQPYMRPAAKSSERAVQKEFDDAIDEIIKKI